MADKPLSIPKAAELIGVAKTTLYRYVDRGTVSTVTAPNGKQMIRESEARRVKAWLEGTDVEKSADPS